jgi:hypothetical protein
MITSSPSPVIALSIRVPKEMPMLLVTELLALAVLKVPGFRLIRLP